MLLTAALAALTLATAAAQEGDGPADHFAAKGPNGESADGRVLGEADKAAFLKAHNDARKAVGLDPLAWSDDLSRFSLEWIKENHDTNYWAAALAGNDPALKHRPQGADAGKFRQRYGENAYFWSGDDSFATSPADAVASWLEEKAAFDKLKAEKPYVVGDEVGKRDEKGNPVVVGHYTQIVWKDTKKVGAASWTFRAKGRKVVVVFANYDPAGNYTGQSPY